MIYHEIENLKIKCNNFQKQIISLWISGGLNNIVLSIISTKNKISKEEVLEQIIYFKDIVLQL